MKSVILWALVVLNVLLLSVVVDRNLKDNTAIAGAGNLGNVLAVPGALAGANNGVVFLLDTTNKVLSAISYDSATKTVAAMKPLDIQRVIENAGGARRPGK